MIDFKELFYYDPTSPTYVRHKVFKGTSIKPGMQAGTYAKPKSPSGVLVATVEGVKYTKSIPVFIMECHDIEVPHNYRIWHLDGNKRNNLFENLELVDFCEWVKRERRWEYDCYRGEGERFLSYHPSRNSTPWKVSITSRYKNSQAYFPTRQQAQEFVNQFLDTIKAGDY